MLYSGKVALVTGGGRGIGAATARLLVEKGATVVVSYAQNKEAAEALAQSVTGRGGKIIVNQSDARAAEQVKQLVQRA